MKRTLHRYSDRTRINHWAVALLFLCAGLSGLAFFHPALFPLTLLFGGAPWTRVLHPFFGVLMVLGFVFLFAQVWRENLWKPRDTAWMKAAPQLIKTGDEASMPPVGKYNAGQKLVFWQPWFADFFPILARRVAVVVHAASATLLVLSVIAHVYAAIWVKGTMRAMTRGTVTESWARRNHPLWYREMSGENGSD